MARIDPELARLMSEQPGARLEAILRASADLDQLLAALGREVRIIHVYRLIRGVAVEAPAKTLRRLASSSVVASIEPVRRVKHS